MISVAAMGNTLWVFDLKWMSYTLEQAERLMSHATAKEVMRNFAWNPLTVPSEFSSLLL